MKGKRKNLFLDCRFYSKFYPRIKLLALLVCMALFMAHLPASGSQAASMRLYYFNTKKTVTYSDAQISYVYNDKKISLNGIPGILTENGVALGPYYEIFKALGVSCKKNSSKNTITFKKGNTTLVLTVNSSTALLNGQPVTMNATPVSVKYLDAKKSRILVPTRFVAESLGFDYYWDSQTSTVTIKSKMTLFYNGKQVSYSGTTGKVTFDGKEIAVTKLPTILISNTAMLRAYTVFKTAMGVKYTYNQSTGKITFKQGDITLTMQEGSTIAYLNGEIRDCGVAPILVKNVDNGTEALLVPGRFVAESLGYDYTWNAVAKTSEIKTTDKVGVYIPPVVEEEEPEEEEFYSFVVDERKYLEFENIVNETVTEIDRGTAEATSYIQNLYKDDNEIFNEKYIVEFGTPVTQLSSLLEKGKLTIIAADTLCISKEYTGFYGILVSGIHQYFDSATGDSVLEMDLLADYPYYNLALSEDGRTLGITVYPNYLVGLAMGKNQYGYYIRFKGLQAFQYETGEENDCQVIYFRNTANTLGNINFSNEFSDIYFNYAVMYETDPTQLKLVYKTANGKVPVMQEEANELYLYFDYKKAEDTNRPIDNTAIQVSLPDGIFYSSVTSADEYWNKKITITIPGDCSTYYEQHPIKNTYASVEDISIAVKNGDTVITLSTSRIQGFYLTETAGGFQITIGNPSSIYDKIVVLDAGHGGIDPGASAGGYNEKDINFKILNGYAKAYFDDSDIKVYFTRLTDVKIDLYERADFATQVEADLFISLHQNAFSSSSANGTAVYYSALNNSINSGGLTSKAMASALVNNLSSALGTKNNGTPTANFVVIKETQVPAVLIELAFITNSSDRKIITSSTTQKLAAKTIYETTVTFFQKYPTGR